MTTQRIKQRRKKEEKQFVHFYRSADSHKKDSNYCKYKLIIQFIQNIGIRCITVLECALHMTATRGQWSTIEIHAMMSNCIDTGTLQKRAGGIMSLLT